jgi:hypothetical protein
MDVSIEEQVTCAERELRMRERVYPRQVASGKMTDQLAERELRAMTAIVATLRRLRQAAPTQGGLPL